MSGDEPNPVADTRKSGNEPNPQADTQESGSERLHPLSGGVRPAYEHHINWCCEQCHLWEEIAIQSSIEAVMGSLNSVERARTDCSGVSSSGGLRRVA